MGTGMAQFRELAMPVLLTVTGRKADIAAPHLPGRLKKYLKCLGSSSRVRVGARLRGRVGEEGHDVHAVPPGTP